MLGALCFSKRETIMATRLRHQNQRPTPLQLKRYRYGLWIDRLQQYDLISQKCFSLRIKRMGLISFKPSLMKRLDMRLGDSFTIIRDDQRLALRRQPSSLATRISRLKARCTATR